MLFFVLLVRMILDGAAGLQFIIQGKWGITCYNDRDKISSGTEEIQGNRKADLQLQLKVKW